MDDRTPVLIGAGQFTYRGDPAVSPSPTALLKIAADRAAADAGLPEGALAGIDALAVVGFTVDAPGGGRLVPHSTNPPATLARRLGAAPQWSVYSHMGGNSPQQLVNALAERIARGDNDFALIVGCEFLGSATKRLTKGLGFADWDDADELPGPERIGDPRSGVSPYEARHGLARPSTPIRCSRTRSAPVTAARSPTTRSAWASCSRPSPRSPPPIPRPGSRSSAPPRS
jgi:acetyl-CoA C-acetyltransferase